MDQQSKPQALAVDRAAIVAFALRDLLGYFLRLGTFGFGGPIALAGYMQRDLVEERHWISRVGLSGRPRFRATFPRSACRAVSDVYRMAARRRNGHNPGRHRLYLAIVSDGPCPRCRLRAFREPAMDPRNVLRNWCGSYRDHCAKCH